MERIIEISDRLIRQISNQFKRSFLTEIEWSNRLIELRGARGSGKTTILLQRAKELQKGSNLLYTSLDLPYFYSNYTAFSILMHVHALQK